MSRPAHSLSDLFDQHAQHVYRRALRLMGSAADAEEATQEVFIRAMPELARLDEEEPVRWLYRVTTNYCLNQLRDRKRRREILAERHGELAGRVGGERADAQMTLRALLANADPQQATCAAYVYFDDLTYTEVAEVMGVSRRTISNLMDRFRAWAREQLEGESP
ncbi:MAG: sigma-70 family RNA polymerase sigma factor [Myxococcales bacterium]|nr:sigma-70 family RNA polymerase sigma factor [Myxococcales bacterium]MCB9546953.1 sigma-70 family RNA polymerase sigma factor [Myxococcales bacterium]